jgi:hypothetical protein
MGCGGSTDAAAQIPATSAPNPAPPPPPAPPRPPPPGAPPAASDTSTPSEQRPAAAKALTPVITGTTSDGKVNADDEEENNKRLVRFYSERQIEDHADDTYLCFNPKLGFVLKTFQKETGKKIFINVLHHDLVQSFLSAILDEVMDKNHNDCSVYTVVIPTYLFLCCKDDEEVRRNMFQAAVQHMSDFYRADADSASVRELKVKRGFIGESEEKYLRTQEC